VMRVRKKTPQQEGDANGDDVPGHTSPRRIRRDKKNTQLPEPGISMKNVFWCLVVVRLISAFFNNISDCDETFNYWEPSHYLLYGFGFQTWEYSPEFMLRPYLYVSIHSFIGWIFSFLSDKVAVFYSIRMAMALFCAFCETIFIRGTSQRFGDLVGKTTLLILVFSTGMFQASTAHLPNTFSMYSILLSFGFWFSANYFWAVFSTGLGIILGWPFVAVMFIPLGLDLLYQNGFLKVFLWAVITIVFFLAPSVLVDYHYYKRPVIAVWNLIYYNVFDPNTGSQLYGVEPWSFYFINSFLNFSFFFFISLISLPSLLVFKKWSKNLNRKDLRPALIFMFLAPLYIWIGCMLKLPHKEERFLYVIYPLIALGAAVSIVLFYDVALVVVSLFPSDKISIKRGLRKLVVVVIVILVAATCGMCFSRTVALRVNYGAPFHVYHYLAQQELPMQEQTGAFDSLNYVNICVGKEWYRFTTSFFLARKEYRYSFIKSAFTGELPQLYGEFENATWIIPEHFNDQNREEPSRYISPEECAYMIDLEFEGQHEKFYSQEEGWEEVVSFPFLHKEQSHPFFRAFYVPFLSDKYTSWAKYSLLKNTAKV